jgi:hypothetical protein
MLGFGLLQTWIVINHHNPTISVEESSDAYVSADDKLNMNADFFMAFTVEDYET